MQRPRRQISRQPLRHGRDYSFVPLVHSVLVTRYRQNSFKKTHLEYIQLILANACQEFEAELTAFKTRSAMYTFGSTTYQRSFCRISSHPRLMCQHVFSSSSLEGFIPSWNERACRLHPTSPHLVVACRWICIRKCTRHSGCPTRGHQPRTSLQPQRPQHIR